MSDPILLWAISGLVAGSTGWLLITAARTVARRRAPGIPAKGSWMHRLRPWLASVPMPGWLERRVAEEDHWAPVLASAAVPWRPRSYLAFRWLTAWASLFLALLVALIAGGGLGTISAVLLAVAGWLGPLAWLRFRAERRRRDVERELPDFLDRLTLALSAGLGFEVALRRTAAALDGLLGEELRRCVRYLDWGQTKTEAMAQLTTRNPSQDISAFAAAVRQAESLGSSLATTLRVQRDLMRARRRRRAQEASRRLPVLILFPLVFFFLPALLIVFLAPPLLHLFLGR